MSKDGMSTSSKEPASYPSADGRTTVRATIWHPENRADAPRGIVQIVHGMSEYVDRYDDFARYLTDCGFVVCGNDHVGHGRSVSDFKPSKKQLKSFANPGGSSEWGHVDLGGGHDVLVEDAIALMDMMRTRYPGVPYFLFGHSMGSFVARCVMGRRGEDLAGVIACGTGYTPPTLSMSGAAMARAAAKLRGPKHHSKTLRGLADGAYSKAVKNARTDFDWLNTDPDEVDRYIADPACGFPFTAAGYVALMGLTGESCDPSKAANVPSALPVLLVSGDEDPVGDNGDGVRQVAELLEEAGVRDVAVNLYPGMRHEILKEPGHMEVYDDIRYLIEAISERL